MLEMNSLTEAALLPSPTFNTNRLSLRLHQSSRVDPARDKHVFGRLVGTGIGE